MKIRVPALRIILASLGMAGLGAGVSPPAHAIGCISGGVAGAVAGHMAHHGVLGAIGGCIAGHEYHKHEQRSQSQDPAPHEGGDSNHYQSGAPGGSS